MTFQTRALELAQAFILETRDDGSQFYCLSVAAPQWMLSAVYTAHHEELPNDWRYDKLHELAQVLAQHESAEAAQDAALNIADNLADIYNGAILAWYADMPSRISYADQWISDAGIESSDNGIIGHLGAGQVYCIEQMAHDLIDACEAAQAAMVEAAA